MKTTANIISLIVLFTFTSPLWAADLTNSGYARKIAAEEVDAHVIDGSARVITALNILAKSSEITTPNCTDPDNPDVAKYLGGIDVGRWVEYRIDVQKEGSYRLYPRISSPNANRAFDVYIDGVKVTSIMSGAATGGWQNWETRKDEAQTVNLESGIHTLRLEFTQKNLNLNILYFEYNTHVINGNTRVITARNIRAQSSEISPYNSTDSENPDVTKHLGYCNFDEWVEYQIDVQKGGSYKLYPRIASNGVTGAFEVDIDGVQVASFTSGGATSGWQWSTREEQAQTVNLEQGMHTLRLIFTEKGLNLNILYFDYNVHVINGDTRVVTALNILAKSEEISTPNCTDPDNPDVARYLGNIDVGRWVEYHIDVQKGGSYKIYPRISSPNANRAFDVYIDDVQVASITSGAATSGWQNWETRKDEAQTVNLESGIRTLRLEFTQKNLNLNILYFEYDKATSLSENQLGNSVKIYPNPVQRGQDIQIDVQLTQGKAGRAELYDITGKRVASFEITGNRTNLPTTLNPGLYLLKTTGRELYKEAKIVVL